MKHHSLSRSVATLLTAGLALASTAAISFAAPTVLRLTPPSALFSFGDPTPPIIARFLPGQRFDLQATIVPDAGQTITSAQFSVNGTPVAGTVTLTNISKIASISVANGGAGYTSAPAVVISGNAGATATATIDGSGAVTAVTVIKAGVGFTSVPTVSFSGGGGSGATASATLVLTGVNAALRAYSSTLAGTHTLSVSATQSDSAVTAPVTGNFEVVGVTNVGKKARNIIVMIGDGMGASHRTAARIMRNGIQQGKATDPLNMDTFPNTAMVMTASLNSIVTDSSPGAACYSTGNKSNNNQEGVFPDDTADKFDNPRVEFMAEYLKRTQGKSLGIVTTADVFDATPAAFAIHTQDRGAGTGICDMYLDDRGLTGLTVLLGGGRKWFLPNTASGSARTASLDYVLPADIVAAWGSAPGAIDAGRDLLANFQAAGFTYAPDNAGLNAAFSSGVPAKLLGLFSLSNMNVAKDKIDGRRGNPSVVNDYGFPDQPMLDEMTDKALQVLSQNPLGFSLMVEGASIDKQTHNMDAERAILDTLEFDRAIGVARTFAQSNPDTLIIITADHECGGFSVIGASTVTNASLITRAASGIGAAQLRKDVVGVYEAAGFPTYITAGDGYPVTTDIDNKMLIGFGGNGDRYEDWLTNLKPIHDSQQSFDTVAPLSGYPRMSIQDATGAVNQARPIRDIAGNFQIIGHVDGTSAVHTGGDIPCSAFGRGAKLFNGTIDNTDVFFKAMQAAIGGAAN